MGKSKNSFWMNITTIDTQPNHTIYVNNLSEKLSKEDTKKVLYAAFSQFGRILEIVALRTNKLRGQAWIIFENLSSSTNAMKTMHGFLLCGKPLRVQYARMKSDIIKNMNETYSSRSKRSKKQSSLVDISNKTF